MQIVIDISEEMYEDLKYLNVHGFTTAVEEAVANGTPLPERHGDLKDMGNLKYMFDLTREDFIYSGKEIERTVKSMTTIIKSNKEEQTKKKAGNEYGG